MYFLIFFSGKAGHYFLQRSTFGLLALVKMTAPERLIEDFFFFLDIKEPPAGHKKMTLIARRK